MEFGGGIEPYRAPADMKRRQQPSLAKSIILVSRQQPWPLRLCGDSSFVMTDRP
jgi:hypothetical protein